MEKKTDLIVFCPKCSLPSVLDPEIREVILYVTFIVFRCGHKADVHQDLRDYIREWGFYGW